MSAAVPVFVRKAAGKRRSSDSGVGPERGAVCREKKEQRFALFLRDFDQQAKEHIQEMKEELSSLLQTAEKAFAVELLKMPVAVRNMRRKDFLSLEGGEEAALAAVVADCSLEDIPNPKLVRTNSRKVKVTTIVQYEDAKHTSAKKMSRKVSKTKSLVSLASGFSGKVTPLSRSGHSSAAVADTMKSLASDCGATNFKTMAKVSKSAGLHHGVCRTEPGRGRVHGMVLRSKSAPQDKTVPFVNIPLADGQTLCTAGGDLHNIDVQLLRQDTIQRIHNLVSELTVLYGKATAKTN
ncbi:borealin-2-like [Patagioenas fasciata]|uniref:borealin-2-like n=1 Tax=Patagioenas fasciata TaxID=372321 RepID=UPI0032E91336